MTVIPAIDILGGRCVRLTKGSYADVSVYNEDPVAVAREFEQAGASRIHIVDLDAARGDGNNRRVIADICAAVACTVEVGGGVRRESDVDSLLAAGVSRVVVGTELARNADEVAKWCERYGRVMIAGIDALDGQVRVSGWQEAAALVDTELAARAREIGCISVIYTSIGRDGMLQGPDIERTNAVARAARIPVILSGGISSVADLDRVAEERYSSVYGIIVGKALYEGRVRLSDALRRQTGNAGAAALEADAPW